MVELDNAKEILKKAKIRFEEKNKMLIFLINKRKIKILINKRNKIEVRILKYNGLNPFCHIRYERANKEGLMCLDATINAFSVDNFKSKYIDSIKGIISERNHLEDSFNDLYINLLEKYIDDRMQIFMNYYLNTFFYLPLNQNAQTSKFEFPKECDIKIDEEIIIKWKGFRFRNASELKKCLRIKKKFWEGKMILIIFEHNKRKEGILVEDNKLFSVNLEDPQTMMFKTGANIRSDHLIVIVGLGSLGSEIFERFRLGGFTNFVLIDNDMLERDNNYRWAYPIHYFCEKVELIKLFFPYLNITTFNKKIEEINEKDINLNHFMKNKPSKLIFIDSTTSKKVENNSLKLWYDFSKANNFKESTYKLTFLEENGLSLHTFSINYSTPSNSKTYKDELNIFSKNNLETQVLERNEKYIYEKGCVGETQIYSQNSTKMLSIKANHLMEEGEYKKINVLSNLVSEKPDEQTVYYKKLKEKKDEIDVE